MGLCVSTQPPRLAVGLVSSIVNEGWRKGKRSPPVCMKKLRELGINKVTLVAFKRNDGGNAFWRQIGWKRREDYNNYEFVLNEKNITRFIGAAH